MSAVARDDDDLEGIPDVNQALHDFPAEYWHAKGLLSNKDLIEKVLEFCSIFSGKDWYSYQTVFAKRIIESVILNDGEVITGLWSRQSGKTDVVANVGAGLAIILPVLATKVFSDDPRLVVFKNGFWLGIFAPIEEQANISHSRMRTLVTTDHANAILEECAVAVTNSNGGNLTFSCGSYIHARSASPESKIEGKTYHLIVIEEAQLVTRYKVNKEIAPMLSSTDGSLVKIGTAYMSKGGFHNSIQYNVTRYEAGGKRNHFEFPYTLVIKEKRRAYKKDGNVFHLNYERWISKEIQRLGGTENEEFDMNFKLLWKETRRIAIRESLLLSLGDPRKEANSYTREGRQVAGLDLAKIGDSSVVTILGVDGEPLVDTSFKRQFGADSANDQTLFYNKAILGWLELQGSWEGDDGQYQRVCQYLAYWGVGKLVIDATGAGDPIYERFTVLLDGIMEVVPYKYTRPSKSDLFKNYIQELLSKRVSYPAGRMTKETWAYKQFIKQHINLDREFDGEYLVVQAPEGEHDDYPNSAALACWAAKLTDDMPEIDNGSKTRGRSEMATWKSTNAPVGKEARYGRRW